MRDILGRSQGRIGLMKRFPTRQEHLLSSAASGLRPPLPTCLPASTPRKSGRLPGGRPALGACPAGQSPPGCASTLAGKAASQPTAGRAWLWRNSRNPYNFIGRNGYLWLEPQKSPLLGNTMILQKTNFPMVEPQTSRAGSSGQ